MDLIIRYRGQHKFETIAGTHRLISDQPLDHAGEDAGPTPPELFLFSLGSCAGYYAAAHLNARGLPGEALEIHVSGTKGDRPARFVSIRMVVVAPGLNKHHRDGILRAVEACLISNTIIHPPVLEVTVAGQGEAELLPAHVGLPT